MLTFRINFINARNKQANHLYVFYTKLLKKLFTFQLKTFKISIAWFENSITKSFTVPHKNNLSL